MPGHRDPTLNEGRPAAEENSSGGWQVFSTSCYYTKAAMATPAHRGLRHLALRVTDLNRSRVFYERFLGMKVVWEPDPENVYLSSGADNLALHQIPASERDRYQAGSGQFLDHFGVIVESREIVDELFADVQRDGTRYGAVIAKSPKLHRDGSYSFYFTDPDGNVIQALYEPDISRLEWVKHNS
jgi:catechol 2,3-dioxygenase-like lactoylglutathione lyase family enzyme